MSWSKKVMDKLGITKQLAESTKEAPLKKSSVNSLRKTKINKYNKNFANPVAASKKSRDKTDALPYN